MKKKGIFLITLYGILCFLFAVFTYTQIDLNLTLSSNPVYQSFQNILIGLGYYNRPLSTLIFIILISLSFIFYYIFLKIANKEFFKRIIKPLIIINVFLALVSYPAFSHDFFNYLFDARIVTNYHLNPYQFKALDFPNDLWIRFMHWTHRTYPYGPIWLLSTLPFSFFGFGKFVLTMVLFKAMFAVAYLANINLIRLISAKTGPKNYFKNTALYALNPLVIVETLISPHNESLMLTFLLLSLYFLILKNKTIPSYFWLIVSAGVKFITIVLLPVYFIKKSIKNHELFLKISLALLLVPLSLEIANREAYPWYFIPMLGIASLSSSVFLTRVTFVVSLTSLFRYGFFLYRGSYLPSDYLFMDLLVIIPCAFVLIYFLRQRERHNPDFRRQTRLRL